MRDRYLKLQLLIRPNGAMPPITVNGKKKERSGFAVPEFYPRLSRYIATCPITDLDLSSSEARKRSRAAMRDFVKKAFWDETLGKSHAQIPEGQREDWELSDSEGDDEDSCFNPQTGDWDERPTSECTSLILHHKLESGSFAPDYRPFEDAEAEDFRVVYMLHIVTRRP